MPVTILAIESSCDETSAAISQDGAVLSNIIAIQKIHEIYGGVVPELASRAHQSNIVPVVEIAIESANIQIKEIDAIAFTQGPGLLGALLVGASFAKGLSLALQVPLIAVHHMQAHILAHFAEPPYPTFPFICLTVSGGHTQIVLVNDFLEMHVLGQTIDDAAGEAYDKSAKIIGLSYPGGPQINKLAIYGNPLKFKFALPQIANLNFSFSGLKTSILYFIQAQQLINKNFIDENLNDLCASIQFSINSILLKKVEKAAQETGICQIAIAGGVSANTGLRDLFLVAAKKHGWHLHIPKFEYCTDNAAMIAITGHYKYLNNEFAKQSAIPFARMPFPTQK